ncbi:hypoxanthine-guanine phosphoribosyltransferase [Salinicola sp. LHM]|uniref:hypoxanthine-guanine phosphoribosyltransferase n=1 Tax=Salinicola TaxID=404432 RepID=UPI0008DDF5AD|nr:MULTISPECIES: hypoxanthine-guanine phosphoribosyltransferase [Salinicola]MEC8916676.1 hypoxanthine-guanine phosphoribosyltransferase [Pseudomonadota bacterium]MED5499466.1 hypoxanthine-guanine phosphoribosyltransferase [Pseudomonadota bacterium]OHZ04272.1 hypoxanthine-guanine phosphoribosyltransferase [Salinicola sp. MIT1003]WQH34798.1 hypoxanthine-guanine phosphoribosyltransferase [Salinicola sp. LHM]
MTQSPPIDALSSMQEVMDSADCLIDQAQVERALDRMAADITRELGDKLPVFYCVMNGGLITTGHLLTRLGFPLEVDYLHATRYRGGMRGGELFWRVSPEVPMAGRHVVIVDDILDEGATLAAILDYCRQAGAASISTAVLVDKRHDRKASPDLKADYCGLEVVDRYVFGFGMDYKGYWRNAPGIFAPKGM